MHHCRTTVEKFSGELACGGDEGRGETLLTASILGWRRSSVRQTGEYAGENGADHAPCDSKDNYRWHSCESDFDEQHQEITEGYVDADETSAWHQVGLVALENHSSSQSFVLEGIEFGGGCLRIAEQSFDLHVGQFMAVTAGSGRNSDVHVMFS
jgi:hypothetical protein